MDKRNHHFIDCNATPVHDGKVYDPVAARGGRTDWAGLRRLES